MTLAPDIDYVPGLTNIETRILLTLLNHAGKVFSYPELSEAVYGYLDGGRALNVHVRRLRAKLGRDAVTTVHGRGFMAGKVECCPTCNGQGFLQKET